MDDMDKLLEEIRQGVESKVVHLKERALPGNRGWVNVHGAPDPQPSNYDVLQVHILLKILDRLESIDMSLTSLDKEMWDERHNK